MKLLSRLPGTEELKREKIYVIFLFLGLVLVAFVFITLGDMLYRQTEDFPALIDAVTNSVVLKAIGISISMAIASTLIAFFFRRPISVFPRKKGFPR